MKNDIRLIVGCMTGTSIDGLDVALVEIHGVGLAMKVVVRTCLSCPLGSIGSDLRRIAEQQPASAENISRIARHFGLLHLNLIQELIEDDPDQPVQDIDLIAVHGQTVFHKPPLSWQLINPAPIAYGLGVLVVHDMRAADLVLGGQGAPITPIADYILFRSRTENRCIVNLGGFCNVTFLPESNDPNQIGGGDVCACNQVLDGIARELLNIPFDPNGQNAASGSIQEEPYDLLCEFLKEQFTVKQSLGTGDELFRWINRYRDDYSPNDLARSACAAIAVTIRSVLSDHPIDRVIAAGGGAFHRTLLTELRRRMDVPVELTDQYGIPVSYREAVAMAVLGALCQDRVPITLPQITHVKSAPISGCWITP